VPSKPGSQQLRHVGFRPHTEYRWTALYPVAIAEPRPRKATAALIGRNSGVIDVDKPKMTFGKSLFMFSVPSQKH
jgi:hypothetical protein